MGCTAHFGAFSKYFVIGTISRKSNLKVQLGHIKIIFIMKKERF